MSTGGAGLTFCVFVIFEPAHRDRSLGRTLLRRDPPIQVAYQTCGKGPNFLAWIRKPSFDRAPSTNIEINQSEFTADHRRLANVAQAVRSGDGASVQCD